MNKDQLTDALKVSAGHALGAILAYELFKQQDLSLADKALKELMGEGSFQQMYSTKLETYFQDLVDEIEGRILAIANGTSPSENKARNVPAFQLDELEREKIAIEQQEKLEGDND
mgnify:CR=1 FL=1